MALDVSTLTRRLIGGMDIQVFDREIREISAKHFAATIDPAELDRLYGVDRLESLLGSDSVPIQSVDIFHSNHLMRLADVQKKSGRSCLQVALDQLRRGSTIRVRDLDSYDGQLNALAREVQVHFAARAQINMYLTPPAAAGFPPHFDTTDVMIVQCTGKKDWKIFSGYANEVQLPTMDINWDSDLFQPSGAFEMVTLSAGDVLYLPRGIMHEAFCADRESLHLTISIEPLTFADLIKRALTSASESDVEFRRRVPWTISGVESDLEDLTRRTQQKILDLSRRLDVGALLQSERRTFDPVSHETTSGQFQSTITKLLESRPTIS